MFAPFLKSSVSMPQFSKTFTPCQTASTHIAVTPSLNTKEWLNESDRDIFSRLNYMSPNNNTYTLNFSNTNRKSYLWTYSYEEQYEETYKAMMIMIIGFKRQRMIFKQEYNRQILLNLQIDIYLKTGKK
jgi:hypothetical protein